VGASIVQVLHLVAVSCSEQLRILLRLRLPGIMQVASHDVAMHRLLHHVNGGTYACT
jgi:hypothetical protein